MLLRPGEKFRGDGRKNGRLKFAIVAGDDAMTVLGKKTQGQPAVFVRTDGVLGFVAITLGGGRGEQGLDGKVGKPADPMNGVGHPLVLDATLLCIGDVTKHATATLEKLRAIGFDAGGRGGKEFLCFSEGVIFADLQNSNTEGIAFCGGGDEDGHTFMASDTIAFGGGSGDFQGDDIVFLEHGIDPFQAGNTVNSVFIIEEIRGFVKGLAGKEKRSLGWRERF